MIWLILTILFSFAIGIIFKKFPDYGVNTFHAIVVNYIVCTICGSVTSGKMPSIQAVQETWFGLAVVLGCLFISAFTAIGWGVQKLGLGATTVTQKMSLIVSAPFAFWYFHEPFNIFKLLGLLLAVAAIILSNQDTAPQPAETVSRSKKVMDIVLPVFFIFFISGLIECGLQYAEKVHLAPAGKSADPYFLVSLFGTAGTIGILAIIVQAFLTKKTPVVNSLIGGVVLGLPNFCSIYFLIKALSQLNASVVYPALNMATIALAAIAGWAVFNEKLSNLKKIGIAAAIGAIFLMVL